MSRRAPYLAILLLSSFVLPALPVSAEATYSSPETAYAALDVIKRDAGAIPQQAWALAQVAWPDEMTDPGLSSEARRQLRTFGRNGIGAMRRALRGARPIYHADIVAAMLQSHAEVIGSISQDYLPGLEDAIWYGSYDAKRMAIIEVTRFRYPPSLTSMVDAAVEHTDLRLLVINSLGEYGSDKARAYLYEILSTAEPELREAAARSMVRIGERALIKLREVALGDDAKARKAAIRALLPVSSFDDLGVLFTFMTDHADDDPVLTEWVRQRATLLEELRELDELTAESE